MIPSDLRKNLNKMLGQYRLVANQSREERKRLDKNKERMANLQEAQGILQEVAEKVQQSAHEQIAAVVSRCLTAVFGEEAYEFRIQFEKKRGKTEADLRFVRDGNSLDPTTAAGGGVVEVAAFALRLACLVLARPRSRKVLFLDEPFSRLSEDYVPAVRDMLEKLADEMGIQFVMVTHDQGLRIGKVIEL